MQYIKLKFGWVFGATGPEVQADTLYWNDGEFSVIRERMRLNIADKNCRGELLSLG